MSSDYSEKRVETPTPIHDNWYMETHTQFNEGTGTMRDTLKSIKESLELVGLPRTSNLAGGELTGWMGGSEEDSRRYLNGSGFAARRVDDTTVELNLVVSGMPHLRYTTWVEHNEDAGDMTMHRPLNPEKLFPTIQAVVEEHGFTVTAVRMGGYQRHWDDDVDFVVTVQA